MPGQFQNFGPFAEGLGIRDLGLAAERLTKALRSVPEAHQAARALGDCQRAVKRIEALTILDALPSDKQARIRAEFLKQCRREVA